MIFRGQNLPSQSSEGCGPSWSGDARRVSRPYVENRGFSEAADIAGMATEDRCPPWKMSYIHYERHD